MFLLNDERTLRLKREEIRGIEEIRDEAGVLLQLDYANLDEPPAEKDRQPGKSQNGVKGAGEISVVPRE